MLLKECCALKITFNLRKIRLEKKMTQKQLARLSGLSQSHISELELGKEGPTLKAVESIANALHVHPFELLHVE